MNKRQKELVAYLLLQDKYASQAQILTELHEYAGNSRLIRRDVRDINTGEFSKIVISSNKGYKIANQEEAEAYLEAKRKTALRMLTVCEKVKHKLQNHGQVKVNNAGNIIVMNTCEK